MLLFVALVSGISALSAGAKIESQTHPTGGTILVFCVSAPISVVCVIIDRRDP